MTKYRLIYDGDFHGEYESLNEILTLVKCHHEDYLADIEKYPEMYGENDDFGWELYEINEVLDMDLKRILTTNHRGTFPKSHRAEGVNFVD